MSRFKICFFQVSKSCREYCDVFNFQESDEESVKTAAKSRVRGSNADTVIEEVVHR